uniref:Uncharacterized protein n=1 Tax=Myoviridae sp. ctfrL10 TaxID=2826678 RepID=A0A8S5MRB3_9CAUD|nr:MAG TPA: hypothetical protein [Myoviridae sp. ctfrL10]
MLRCECIKAIAVAVGALRCHLIEGGNKGSRIYSYEPFKWW